MHRNQLTRHPEAWLDEVNKFSQNVKGKSFRGVILVSLAAMSIILGRKEHENFSAKENGYSSFHC